MRWQDWRGERVVRWQVGKGGREGGRVLRWEGGRFLVLFKGQGAGWVRDFIFLFLMLINETKEEDVFKIFLRGRRNGKTLLRSYGSRKNVAGCGSVCNS